jgi:hypothetical protein
MNTRAGLDIMEKIKFLPLPGIEPSRLGHPDGSLVALPTELDTNPERQLFVLIVHMFFPVSERDVMTKKFSVLFFANITQVKY